MKMIASVLIVTASILAVCGCSPSSNRDVDGLTVTARKAGGAIEARFTANGEAPITVANATVLALTPSEPGIHLRVTYESQRIEKCGYLDYRNRSPDPTTTVMHDGDQFEARIRIEHVATWYCLSPGSYGVRIGHVQAGLEVWSDVIPIRVTAY